MTIMRETVRMDADHPIFASHFPGMPVVPGSVAVRALLRLLGERARGRVRLEQFRFRRFMPPGDYVLEAVLREGEGRADCRVLDGEAVCVSGRIVWERA